jgi:hypothetical protein
MCVYFCSMIDTITAHTGSTPKLKASTNTRRWSLLFLYDQAFGLTANVKDEKLGKTLKKVDNDTRLGRSYTAAHARNIHEIVKRNSGFNYQDPLELPSVSTEEFNKKDFDYWKRHIGKPLVVKGYVKNEPILDLMSEEQLVENYGDQEVKCIKIILNPEEEKMSTVGQNLSTVSTSLREYLTSDDFAGYYINNYYGVIEEDDFLEKSKGHEINTLMGKEHVLAQWFISRKDMASGSTLHCAGADNIFLNITGRKEWYFIDPSYTPIMQPAMSKFGSFCVSELQDHVEWEDFYAEFTKIYPDMKHVPIYKTVLEEGDMLYNPSWWWHRVRNLSPLNIGCATRFVEDRIAFVNSPTLWFGLLIETLKNPKKSLVTIAKKSIKSKKNAHDLIDSIFSKKEENTTA